MSSLAELACLIAEGGKKGCRNAQIACREVLRFSDSQRTRQAFCLLIYLRQLHSSCGQELHFTVVSVQPILQPSIHTVA